MPMTSCSRDWDNLRDNTISESAVLVGHLSHMHREACLRQQRRQLKHFETIARDLRLPIDARLGLGGFMTSFQFIEKSLHIFEARFASLGASYYCLCSIGAHQLRPILL